VFASKTILRGKYSPLIMTCHREVLEAAKSLAARSEDGSFRPKEVKALLIARGTEYDLKTIQDELQRGCINGPEGWATMHAYYERIKRGVYKLAN